MQKKALVSFIKSQRAAVIAGLVLTPFLLAAIEWKAHVAETLWLATTKQPEPYSELYFADPDNLPKELAAGEATKLDFVIANHETTNYQYHYQVVLIKNDGATNSSGDVSLADGQNCKQSITIPPQAPGERLQVVIRLPEKNQEIRFRTEAST